MSANIYPGKVNLIDQNQIGRRKFVRPVVLNIVDALCCAAVSALLDLKNAEGNRIDPRHGPNRCRYSVEVMNALTISALTKFPPKAFSFVSQKS